MTGYYSTKKVPLYMTMQHRATEGMHGESEGTEGC